MEVRAFAPACRFDIAKVTFYIAKDLFSDDIVISSSQAINRLLVQANIAIQKDDLINLVYFIT